MSATTLTPQQMNAYECHIQALQQQLEHVVRNTTRTTRVVMVCAVDKTIDQRRILQIVQVQPTAEGLYVEVVV